MGRQWSTGKLVLILDAVHWNPEAPPRTLPRVRLRCALCRGGGTGKETAPKKEIGVPNASPRPTRCANLGMLYS
ncbi:hypothetical protein CRG98_042621 [Punica granatum]|uniref:Uncharacterized protein n=1 Tax=Punica granatum TaxID=22663 RepID=A0A2I0HZ64_PUNGR|nr:hypothetical protein CRG98_042621 [Punica granatum]